MLIVSANQILKHPQLSARLPTRCAIRPWSANGGAYEWSLDSWSSPGRRTVDTSARFGSYSASRTNDARYGIPTQASCWSSHTPSRRIDRRAPSRLFASASTLASGHHTHTHGTTSPQRLPPALPTSDVHVRMPIQVSSRRSCRYERGTDHRVLSLNGACRRCRIRCPYSGISGTTILERSSLPAHPIRDHARNETGNRHRFRCTRSQDKCRHVSTHESASLGGRQHGDTPPTSACSRIVDTMSLAAPRDQRSPTHVLPHTESDSDLQALCRSSTSISRRDPARPHASVSSRPDQTSALNAPHEHTTRTTILSASCWLSSRRRVLDGKQTDNAPYDRHTAQTNNARLLAAQVDQDAAMIPDHDKSGTQRGGSRDGNRIG